MCFDKQSSFLAWSLSCSIAFYLYKRDRGYDKWNAGFIISFATIQLIESGLWLTVENDNKGINSLLTKIILLTLVSQPLVQTYLGYKYTKSDILGILSFVFAGIMLWSILRVVKSPNSDFSSTVGPNGHLVWEDSSNKSNFMGNSFVGIMYLLGLFIPLMIGMQYRSKEVFLIAVGICTAIYSLLYAGPKQFNSYWCFTAVAYSIAAIFV